MIRATVKPLDSETRPYTIQVPDTIPLVLIRQDTRKDPAVRVLRLMYPAMGSNVPPIYTECGPAGFAFLGPEGLPDDVLSPEAQHVISQQTAMCICGRVYRDHPAVMPDDGPWPEGCDGFKMALPMPGGFGSGPPPGCPRNMLGGCLTHTDRGLRNRDIGPDGFCDVGRKARDSDPDRGPSSQGRYGDEVDPIREPWGPAR